MTSHRQLRPTRAVTRSLSEQAEEVPPAGRMMLIHYMCAAGAVLMLAMNVRHVLAAFTAMAELISR